MTDTAFYNDLAATATDLLTAFGAPGQLVRSGSTYDPETGEATGAAATGEDLIACLFEYDEKMIDGSLIQVGDKVAYVSVDGLSEPKNTDLLLWPTDGATETYTVIKNQKIAPAGVNVLYQLQVRK